MPAILAILTKLPWKWIGIGLVVVGLLLAIDHRGYQRGKHSRDAQVAALTGTIANLKVASAQAAAENLAHVHAVEARNATIQKESADALTAQLADARAATRAYILHHPAPVASHAGEGGLSQPADPASPTIGPAQEAVVAVADIEACTDAFVIATGWQAWWDKIEGQKE